MSITQKYEMSKVNYNLDLRNYASWVIPDYRRLMFDETRFLVLVGGAGAGKSYFAAQKCIYRCLTEPGVRGLMIRKVARTGKQSCSDQIVAVLNDMGLTKESRQIKSTGFIQFHNGSLLLLAGMDDPEKIKSITDIEFIWCEEASELTVEDIEQLSLRLRAPKNYNQIIFTLNPVGGANSSIRRRFVEYRDPQSKVFISTIDNNPFIDPQYRAKLDQLAENNPTLHAIYRKGEWAVAGDDLIFTNWRIVSDKDYPKQSRFDNIYFGLDFGFNAPTALVRVGIIDDRDYYVEELMYETMVTNADLIAKLKFLVRDDKYEIIADSANPDRINEITNSGFWCTGQEKGVNSIIQGIDILKSGRIFVRDGSTNLIKELQEYRWKRGKDGVLLDEPVRFMDHAIDAMRGVAFRVFRDFDKRGFLSVAKWNFRPRKTFFR